MREKKSCTSKAVRNCRLIHKPNYDKEGVDWEPPDMCPNLDPKQVQIPWSTCGTLAVQSWH